jgi:AraC-like DNA-binding protein
MRSELVSPDVSTYRREFKALRDEWELADLGSALGWQNFRHNWLETKDFTLGILMCQVGDVRFFNAQETSSRVWQGGMSDEFVTITRIREGGGRVDRRDGPLSLSAGDAYVSSFEHAFSCHTPEYQSLSVIQVPRRRLQQLGLADRMLTPTAGFTPLGSATDVVFDMFHSFARRAETGSALSRRTLTTVTESVVGLVAAALEENAPVTVPGFPATAPGLSTPAKAFIDANVHDPDLTPTTVAAALHVSRRTLYRSFAHEDQTIASYIRTARLRRVRRDLDAAAGTLSIGDAAARWGFTNGGYFAKLFHDEFGVAPSKYVRRAGGTDLP